MRLVYRETPTVRGGSSRQHFTHCGTEPLGDRRSIPTGRCAFLLHQACGLHASHSDRPCASYDVAPVCPTVSLVQSRGLHVVQVFTSKATVFLSPSWPCFKSHLLCLSAAHLSGNLNFSSLSFLVGCGQVTKRCPLSQCQADRKPSLQGTVPGILQMTCVRDMGCVRACVCMCTCVWVACVGRSEGCDCEGS